MKNYILTGILIAVLAVGVVYTVRHFKRKSGCCGSGGYKVKPKKLSNVQYTKTFTVSGMHCNNCKIRVEQTVNDIKGVAGRVDLKRGKLTVSYSENVDDELIFSRIEKAGYKIM